MPPRIDFDGLHDKYEKLVWYARARPEYLENHPDVKECHDEIRTRFPEECEKLASEEGDWQHGFHSGCLAMSRLIAANKSRNHKKYTNGIRYVS